MNVKAKVSNRGRSCRCEKPKKSLNKGRKQHKSQHKSSVVHKSSQSHTSSGNGEFYSDPLSLPGLIGGIPTLGGLDDGYAGEW